MHQNLYQQWKKDEEAPFEGWNFSYLKNRMIEQTPPWDYKKLAVKLLRESNSVLDMATGGGEIFSTLAPFPKHAVAIEGFHPNVDIAKKRLELLGVKVLEANETEILPFADGEFDLVLNRHGGFNIKELYRITKSKGQFFTQQVGGDNLEDLIKFFGQKPKWPDMVLVQVKSKFEKQGFLVKSSQEWKGKVIFKDVGALVYFLKNIPWIVSNFSVDANLDHLNNLQSKLEKDGKLKFTYSRYLIWAVR